MQKITGLQSKDARSALGKSQGEVSKETGISRAYLSQFENGIRKLTDSELVVLKDYYEDSGFLFNSDSEIEPETKNVSSESLKLQEEIAVASPDGEPILVSAIDLSDLISAIDGLSVNIIDEPIVQEGSVSESFELATSNPDLFESIKGKFDETNQYLNEFLLADTGGSLKEPGFLGSRNERSWKVINILALQQVRYLTMKSGRAPFEIFEISDVPVLSNGKDAGHISKEIVRLSTQETDVDDRFPIFA